MISTGKSQIIRQEKVLEMCGMPPESSSNDHTNFDLTEFQYLNLVNGYSTETETENEVEKEPSPCSSLDNNKNSSQFVTQPIKIETTLPDEEKRTTGNCGTSSSCSGGGSSKTLSAMMINTGSKLQISNVLRERLRRSKSPNPPVHHNKKTLDSNNSMSASSADQKLGVGKFTYLSNRLSNQAGSFFSRSCQGEELTSEMSEKTGSKPGNFNQIKIFTVILINLRQDRDLNVAYRGHTVVWNHGTAS